MAPYRNQAEHPELIKFKNQNASGRIRTQDNRSQNWPLVGTSFNKRCQYAEVSSALLLRVMLPCKNQFV